MGQLQELQGCSLPRVDARRRSTCRAVCRPPPRSGAPRRAPAIMRPDSRIPWPTMSRPSTQTARYCRCLARRRQPPVPVTLPVGRRWKQRPVRGRGVTMGCQWGSGWGGKGWWVGCVCRVGCGGACAGAHSSTTCPNATTHMCFTAGSRHPAQPHSSARPACTAQPPHPHAAQPPPGGPKSPARSNTSCTALLRCTDRW